MKRILLFCGLIAGGATAWSQALTVDNFSFEVDSVTAFPTYRTSITSWTLSTGGYGVNTTAGPFLDNGAVPHGSKVLFLQNAVSASQAVSGFQQNTNYTVQVHVNSRAGTAPAIAKVSLDTTVLVAETTVTAVGGTNPFRLLSQTFESTTSGTKVLKIENTNGGADNTLLVDKVEIFETPTAARDWGLLQ